MKVSHKNMKNLNMASMHMFASRIISDDDSYACSPIIYAEYFGTPPMVFPAPFNIEVAHPCHDMPC
jgi:hypothetical protein